MDVKLIKFITGEEIIVDVKSLTSDMVRFDHPIRLIIIPPMGPNEKPKIAFDQYMPYLEDRTFTIDRTQILLIMTPIKQIIEQYETIVKEVLNPSPIIGVKKPKLILNP